MLILLAGMAVLLALGVALAAFATFRQNRQLRESREMLLLNQELLLDIEAYAREVRLLQRALADRLGLAAVPVEDEVDDASRAHQEWLLGAEAEVAVREAGGPRAGAS